MGLEDADRSPVQWQVTDPEPGGSARTMVWSVVIFAIPAAVVLITYGSAPGHGWVALAALCFTLIGVGIGTIDWWRDRHAVVDLRVERAGRPAEFTVRDINGRVGTYRVDAVERVRVTQSDSWPETLSMRITVGGTTIRTRSGLAEQADPLLRAFEEAGATVTCKVITPD